MTTRRLQASLLVLAGLCCSVPVAAGTVREEFAFAIPIEVSAGAPLQWFDLPFAVYRDAVDPGLRDLRVLNGNGEVVPFVLQRPTAGIVQPRSELPLPLFPLRGDPGPATAALSLRIQGDSTSLEVQGGEHASTLEGPLVAFLIDARQVADALERLTFDASGDDDFSVTAVLEASDDLADWRTVSQRVPLARLRHGGERFENRSVQVQPTRAKFWRLRAQPGGTLPSFDGVRATPVAGSIAVERQMVAVAGQPVPGAVGEFVFDLGANLPVDRLELDLPDINTVAQVTYLARRSPGEPWQSVARAGVYRLQTANDELRSAPREIAANACRYWRVVVDSRGGGLGARSPGLRVGWLAHRVLFVARGAAPFELVYGNFAAVNAEAALDDLLPGGSLPADGALGQPLAHVGVPQVAGGSARLQAPPPPGNWRLGILWSALGVGVLSLGAVAWRLARQMRTGS